MLRKFICCSSENFESVKKEMMLKNCIFREPVIPWDTIVFYIECHHTILFTCGVLEKSYIFQKMRIFYFDWLFTALQLSKCTKCLYKMNTNSI